MKMTKLWEMPQESINGFSDITLHESNAEVKITLDYGKEREHSIELLFDVVLAHKHACTNFCTECSTFYKCYEALIEIDDSNWLKELRQFNKKDFARWEKNGKLKHYILFNDNDGMYQFIARSHTIKQIK